MKTSRGFALIMTLWVLVLLTVVAMNFSFSARRGSASTRNFKEETRAYFYAVSSYEEALSYLFSDKDLSVDFIDDKGDFWTDTARETVTGMRDIPEADVIVNIIDEESRLNINLLPDLALRRLFKNIGIPDDSINELVDSLNDWKDADDLHRLSGAETDYYESLDPPYKAKNGPLDTPEELLLIKGFKREYLYGGENIRPLYPLISTRGLGVNINTASQGLLEALGLNPLDIENLMKTRTKGAGGLRAIPQSFTAAGIGLTQSYNFRVEVTAHMRGGQALKITSVVQRFVKPEGIELKTVYWRESFESSGA